MIVATLLGSASSNPPAGWNWATWVLLHLVVGLTILLILMFYHRKGMDKHAKTMARITAVRETLRASIVERENEVIQYKMIPTFHVTGNVIVENVFIGHGMQIAIVFMKDSSYYPKHAHENNIQVFMPIAGKCEIEMYDKLEDEQPSVTKLLARVRGSDREKYDMVAYLMPGQAHSIRPACAEGDEECELLVITVPPMSNVPNFEGIPEP